MLYLGFAVLLILAASHRRVQSELDGLGGEDTYAIVVPTLVLCCLATRAFLIARPPPKYAHDVRAGLTQCIVLLWAPMWLVVTFAGPFTDVGNGYIASVSGTWCAFGLLLAEQEARRAAEDQGA